MIDVAHFLNVWGAAMWRASWQGGLTALVVWTVCRLVPSMPARFQSWLWRLALLKFVVTLALSSPIEVPLLPAPELPPPELAAAWSIPTLETPASVETVAAIQYRAPGAVQPLLILFVAWAVVVLWQVAGIFVACRKARRLRNGCRPSENQKLLGQLATLSQSAGLGTPPTLMEMEGQGSPLLVGIRRPAIVLPVTTLSRLDDSERAMVIGHELAHVRRGDLFWSLIAAMVRALFFFHPLAWLSERQTRLSQEIAADEFAITLQKHDPVRYAALLISVVSKLGPVRCIPTMSVGMAGSQQSLKRRFSAMRFLRPLTRRTVMAYGIVLGLVAVPAIVPWSVVAAESRADDKPLSADQPPPADKPQSEDKPRPADKPRSEDKPRTEGNPPADQPPAKKPPADKPPATEKPRDADTSQPKKEATVSGKFVSFKGGMLKVTVKDGPSDVWQESQWKVAENIKVISHIRGAATEGLAGQALKNWEPGATISVKLQDGKVTFVEIGARLAADKARDQAPEKAAAKSGPKEKYEWGKFVSFKHGTLTLKANSGALLENRIPENAKALVWNDEVRDYQLAGVAEALNQAQVGTWTVVQIAKETATIRLGARKDRVVGTFVSFKNDRLLILGKNLPESAIKKYGNTLHFNKLPEGVPVHESVDGGEYKLIGTANKVLGNVKEGTLVTFHSEGDDNITLIQIGVPNKK